MRPLPKNFEYGSIHLQTAGIINNMYAIAAAKADNGNIIPLTKEDCCVYHGGHYDLVQPQQGIKGIWRSRGRGC